MTENERTDRETLAANRRLFEQSVIALDRLRDDGERLALIRELILFAQRSGCGYYSSPEIERTLCAIAESIEADCSAPCEKNHFLIVMSEAYCVGGHTRVVERWIEEDIGHRYSLILTRQPKTHDVPSRLMEAVKTSGGEVLQFDGAADPLMNARRLREFACRFEKVVLHIHTDDVVSVLAFGTERFPRPVGLYNHADHLFWIGASVADCVGELRKTGVSFTHQRRGVTDSLLVGIPPEMRRADGSIPSGSSERTLTIVSCGSAEKYHAVMGIDFIAPVERILQRVPNAEFVGIGMTFSDFPAWRAVNRRVGGRIKLLGQVPYERLLSHYDTASLYLDSRPIAGGTAITDALCRGCPVLSFPGPAGQMDWVFDSPALCASDQEICDRAVDVLEKRTDVEALVRQERQAYERHNRPELFHDRITAFLSELEGPHRIRSILPQFDGFGELDEYHYATNNGRQSVWDGLGRILNVHYESTALERRKIFELCGRRFCIKCKKGLHLIGRHQSSCRMNRELYRVNRWLNGECSWVTYWSRIRAYPHMALVLPFKIVLERLCLACARICESALARKAERDPVPESPIRFLALYLPQYHCIPENDAWWGRGFTEWTNVRKALPLFKGHYQPHVPHPDIGYYNLDDVSVMRKQAEMAAKYGIHGFVFYYYHFKGGKRLLEKPLKNWLADTSIDFPFCYAWANENWTRAWDGGESEVIMPQDYDAANLRLMLQNMLGDFHDPRYIKVGENRNTPVLLVYRAEEIPGVRKIAETWRRQAVADGFDGLYLISMQNAKAIDPRKMGFDAAMDFAAWQHDAKSPQHPALPAEDYCVNGKAMRVFRYSAAVSRAESRARNVSYPRYKCACPGWDNTPRRGTEGMALMGSSPEAFAQMLRGCIRLTREDPRLRDNGFVFINAWNEWAEGAHLEPDVRFGYSYLEEIQRLRSEMADA